MYLIFDTETTGLPRNWKAPIEDVDNWPRVVQLAWQLHGPDGELLESEAFLIKPEGYNIPFNSEKIHGISTALAAKDGLPAAQVWSAFEKAMAQCKVLVGHNLRFDLNVMGAEYHRAKVNSPMLSMKVMDTCTQVTADVTQLPGGRGGRFKTPKLGELHHHLFGEDFADAHNATADVEATARSFFELVRRRLWTAADLGLAIDQLNAYVLAHPDPIEKVGLKHINLKAASADLVEQVEQPATSKTDEKLSHVENSPFFHIHTHSQFSVLQATSKIPEMIAQAASDGQPALAITDLGNMMGAFQFVEAIAKHNKQLPDGQRPMVGIVGMEAFLCRDLRDKSTKDDGFQIPLLAKNKAGFHHLAKLSSLAYVEGFYYLPRIDREALLEHKEHVMVTTGGLHGEVPKLILEVGESQAEEAFIWWKEQFGEDFYAEINRHGLPDEDVVNEVLLRFCAKHQVKMVAANNAFYVNQSQSEAHDILLCVKDNVKRSTPIGKGRGFRYGFANDQFYLKSQAEMHQAFADLPEALNNLSYVLAKVEPFTLAREVLLPAFDIPVDFLVAEDKADSGKRGENAYLKHLTYLGAEKRYSVITDEIKERIEFELETIAKTGYPGYFLIVQDFCNVARDMGVSVGPGRGSAAGSAVAYCTGITNVDPIAYQLLFERFLNPDRISLPDIDIDFDDKGRDKVIQYVIDKYGSSQVAQIITYGSMAAKSAIKDAARALDLPFDEADRLTKGTPDTKSLKLLLTGDEAFIKSTYHGEDYEKAKGLRTLAGGNDLAAETLNLAKELEGSMRNTGIHACGVIITPSDIRDLIPVARAKDSDMWCTQFDNAVVEDAGLLKMDFLGLKTLTIIKDSVLLVKERHGKTLDMDKVPLDDEATYTLFQRGETVGIFQYESLGMQKHLKDLKPSVFGDLIAMNALYRPGPIEYIPSFIRRKLGTEEIQYDLADMKEYLEETYGITVYQEQVMLLSQKLAGFTKGQADKLRKAMGKKIKSVLDEMKPMFIEGGKERGHDVVILEKIWKDWEAFASYAFNKSHSTCYAWIAYQTAYLKANFPAEYMSAVLSNNMKDIKQVAFFMEECKRMRLDVKGPDVNESVGEFTVNVQGAIRFGMLGMRGVGAGAVDHLVEQRVKDGPFKSVFDLARRVDMRMVNKGTWEALALGGAFDGFEQANRAAFFDTSLGGKPFIEKIRRYGQAHQEAENSAQVSLFGDANGGADMPEPAMPVVEAWNQLEMLKREKNVNGIFLSAHPLDNYAYEIKTFRKHRLSDLEDLTAFVGSGGHRDFTVAGIVTKPNIRLTKNGKEMGSFTLEDAEGSHEFVFFGKDFITFKAYIMEDLMVMVRGRVQKPGWAKDDNARLRSEVNGIELLSEVMGKRAVSLTIMVEIQDLQPKSWTALANIFQQHEGKKLVNFVVFDPQSHTHSDLRCTAYRVDITKELLKELDTLHHFHTAVKTQ